MTQPFDSRRYRFQNQKSGKPVRWWKAFPCECVDPATGLRDEVCRASPPCNADGRRYEEQELPVGIDGGSLKVLVSETKQEITAEGFGLLQAGSTVISLFRDLMPAARLDRVALLDRFETHREVLVRGALDETDALTYPAYANYLSCRQNRMGGGVDEFNSDHFGVALSGRVRWFGPIQPAHGSRYTIEYLHFPMYYVARCLANRGDGSDALPLPSDWVLSGQPPAST